MHIFGKPTVAYPTLVRGIISGPIRCESADGTEIWLQPRKGPFRLEPFRLGGKVFCVSHLQKKSSYFSLLFDPFIYHQGVFWHLQEQDIEGTWQPGTEKGIYWRTPGWRWQLPDKNSNGTNWILSGGRIPGAHLD